jgi:hypothetical protein
LEENGDKNREERKVEIDMRGDFFNWWGDSGALWRRWVVLLLQCVDVEARDKSGVWDRKRERLESLD